MSEIERRVRELANRLTAWWQSSSKTAKQRGAGGSEQLRREAKARAQQAASRAQAFRESERGQRAAGKISDLRDSGTAKRAEAALNDLRTSEAGQKAQATLSDLRQREPVKKAEENARKVLHDLFTGGPGGSAPGSPGTSGTGTHRHRRHRHHRHRHRRQPLAGQAAIAARAGLTAPPACETCPRDGRRVGGGRPAGGCGSTGATGGHPACEADSASTPGGQTGTTLRFPVGMSAKFIRSAVPHISVPRNSTAWCSDAHSWYTARAEPPPIATPIAGPPSIVHTMSCVIPCAVRTAKQAIRPAANICADLARGHLRDGEVVRVALFLVPAELRVADRAVPAGTGVLVKRAAV